MRAACAFEGVIRTAIHRLKFRHARYLASFLAQVLAESLARRPIEADLLLPVPLSPSRTRQRGFNQSELIVAALARLTPLPPPAAGVLLRPRDTQPQVGLPAAERRCLLVDDVLTTGATLSACAEPLIEAGTQRVMALVVARES